MRYNCLTCSGNSVFLWRHAWDSLINVFRTRMCGQTLLFIVIANCAIKRRSVLYVMKQTNQTRRMKDDRRGGGDLVSGQQRALTTMKKYVDNSLALLCVSMSLLWYCPPCRDRIMQLCCLSVAYALKSRTETLSQCVCYNAALTAGGCILQLCCLSVCLSGHPKVEDWNF